LPPWLTQNTDAGLAIAADVVVVVGLGSLLPHPTNNAVDSAAADAEKRERQ
jgi:hypothetical protein